MANTTLKAYPGTLLKVFSGRESLDNQTVLGRALKGLVGSHWFREWHKAFGARTKVQKSLAAQWGLICGENDLFWRWLARDFCALSHQSPAGLRGTKDSALPRPVDPVAYFGQIWRFAVAQDALRFLRVTERFDKAK